MVYYFTIFKDVIFISLSLFFLHMNYLYAVCFVKILISYRNTNDLGLKPFNIFVVEQISNDVVTKTPNHRSYLSI